MKAWRIALRTLGRDWRGGELRILAASLIVAVAAVTAVGFFTDRVQQAMELKAVELLAGDLVLESSEAPRTQIIDEARGRNLKTARTVSFPSVVLFGDETQLVQVKAADPAYPLRGVLGVSDTASGASVETADIPAPGKVWIEPRLANRLALEVGQTLTLGERTFSVDKLLTYEPDRGANIFRLAPRVLLNWADLESTGLVTPQSRVHYHLIFAGSAGDVANFREWLQDRILPGENIEDIRNARSEMRTAIERSEQYLGLAALVAVLVAGAAIALASRNYAERQADAGALMRSLGASQSVVFVVYASRLLSVGLFASFVGCLAGYLAQTGLAALLQGWFVDALPLTGWRPVWLGVSTGLIALAGFGLAPILRLREVPPLKVLRRELGAPPPAAWVTVCFALAALAALLLLHAPDPKEAAMILGGALALIAVLWLIALLFVRVINRMPQAAGLAWRYGINRLQRNIGSSVLQIVCYSLGITALLILVITRVDLLSEWRGRMSPEAPNHFLINVQPDEVESLRQLFVAHGQAAPTFYPMVRGRLLAINDREINAESYSNPRAQRLVDREFNLSWATAMQADNKIVAGKWWSGDQQARAFSVEAGIAETLGIELGDTLRYVVGGSELVAPVTNLREVEWDTFNVNFFVIATPAALADQPATYVTSFYLPAGESQTQNHFSVELTRQFPSVTVFDVRAVMAQVRAIMDRASLAIEYVFLFTLAAGVMVMFAAIQASQRERRRETALLRALGANRGQVMTALISEFSLLGVLAGLLATVAASVSGYLLATQVFEITYRLNLWLWVWGLGGGALGIGLAGLAGTWRLLNQSPMLTLRHT
ncbi:MAG: ABC transporter permease [Gammaproteobacteria bacterium]